MSTRCSSYKCTSILKKSVSGPNNSLKSYHNLSKNLDTSCLKIFKTLAWSKNLTKLKLWQDCRYESPIDSLNLYWIYHQTKQDRIYPRSTGLSISPRLRLLTPTTNFLRLWATTSATITNTTYSSVCIRLSFSTRSSNRLPSTCNAFSKRPV
jgi:hypothetical protein